MKLILATIIQKFELELVDKKPALPVRRGITIVPSGGVSMIVKSQLHKLQKKHKNNNSSVSV